jgi:hypothetical protein
MAFRFVEPLFAEIDSVGKADRGTKSSRLEGELDSHCWKASIYCVATEVRTNQSSAASNSSYSIDCFAARPLAALNLVNSCLRANVSMCCEVVVNQNKETTKFSVPHLTTYTSIRVSFR